jgi:hypothetical protein
MWTIMARDPRAGHDAPSTAYGIAHTEDEVFGLLKKARDEGLLATPFPPLDNLSDPSDQISS